MKRPLLIIAYVFVCFFPQTVSSALVLNSKTHKIDAVTHLTFFADASSKLTLKEIQSLSLDSFETPTNLSGNALNFGFNNATYWIKLVLQRTADAPREWVIEIPYQGLSEIDFFAPGQHTVMTGAARTIESRSLYHRYFVFPVNLETTPQTYYFRVRSSYSVTIPIEIIERQAFIQETQETLIVQFLYFGGIIALVLYNLQLYISLRDKSYFFYTLFGSAMGLSIFSGNGFGRILLWPNLPGWDQISQSFLISLSGTFSVLFARSYLRTKRYIKKLDMMLKLLAIGYLSIAIGLTSTLFYPQTQGLWHQALMLLTLPYFGLITVACIHVLKTRQEQAEYFLLAWGFLCAGVVIATLRTFGLVPTNTVTSYAIQIGTGFEMLLLSYALSYRIRIERAKRAAAQHDALKAKDLLVESLQSSEARLEALVKERTNRLEDALANERYLREQHVRFGSLISHEFRNPLNNISSQSDLLRREHLVGIDNTSKRTAVISSAANQLSLLFDRWIKSERINKTLGLENLVTIQLNRWVQDLVERYQSSHLNRAFIFVPFSNSLTFSADESLLQIAVINLLDNACKYSPSTSDVTVTIIGSNDEIGIEVHDFGEGIDQKYHQTIFEEGFRANQHQAIHGAGIGLTFVKRIAELHGGRVTISSNVGHGATFTLRFPPQAHAE